MVLRRMRTKAPQRKGESEVDNDRSGRRKQKPPPRKDPVIVPTLARLSLHLEHPGVVKREGFR
jgi:hypothetical protein